MKHLKLFFALFAMLALGVGNAWGAETLYKTALFGADYNSKKVSSYTDTWTATNDGFVVTVVNANNNNNGWAYIKMGRKSDYSVGSITTQAAVDKPISKVTMTIDAVTVKNINSIKLKTSIDGSSFVEVGNFTTSKGEQSVTINNPTANLYYQIEVDCKTGSNGSIQISKVQYYATEDAGTTETAPSLTLDPTSKDFATVMVGEEASQEFTITPKNTTATLSASISDKINYVISGIENNKITVTYKPQSVADKHEAVLTVEAGEEATATVNLTGKAVEALEGTWILVTDASSLKAGDEIIIAAKESDVALSTTQASNNRPEVAITKNDNTITATSETQVLTLQAGNEENTLALYTGDGYLYAASSSSNYLRTETTLSDNSSWSIAVADDGTATLIAQGANNHNVMQYNQSSKLFACYESASQKAIAIYRNTNGQQVAGLAYATTKYLTKLGDAFATPALTNPNSLAVIYSSSDNNVATVAADGAVTIKAAGVVTITASFEGNTSFLDGSAKYTICVTEHAGTQADPYSVADARRVIDVMETAKGVYATGIVSEIVTAYNSEYGNITYNISVDGTTTGDQLQAYRGKAKDGVNFESEDDIKIGDEVVVKGNLKKYNSTYEFDADNQLVSHKRDGLQPDLKFETEDCTANVGEDFVEPALTNPNSLAITYSSSNTTLATVNATTGEVTILAAGKVTITASTTGDATYTAGSASYNITITDPSLAIATLPFAFNGNKAAIETTAGMSHKGLGSDYSASTAPNSQLKFDNTGDWVIVHFNGQADKLTYEIKGNSFSGGTFTVQESADGDTYTDVATYTELGETATQTHTLKSDSRYVKFVYSNKSTGNVGLGNITISKADLRQETGLAWNPETVTLTVGDAFTAPTLSNPNGLTGITFASDNEALATVNNAGAISLVSGKTGIATITAKYAGDATYKAAEVTCVITVSPKSEKVVILAEYNGQWYALKAEYTTDKTDRLAAVAVNFVGGKLYNIAETDKATIEWQLSISGTKATFKNGDNYLTGSTSTTLKLSTTTYEWDFDKGLYLSDDNTRTFIYHKDGYFRNYATTNAIPNSTTYSDKPVVTAPVYDTAIEISDGDNSTVITANAGKKVNVIVDRALEAGSEWYTLCVPFNMPASLIGKAYQISGLIQQTDGYVEVNLAEKTTIEAGQPYLIQPNVTVDKFVVENVTIVNTTGASISKSIAGLSVTMQGVINGAGTTDGLYWVGNGGFLYDDSASKLGLRTYFNITTPSGIAPRMRVVAGENVETGVEDIFSTDAPIKVIENGQLIIIRDGVKYNVQGQKL